MYLKLQKISTLNGRWPLKRMCKGILLYMPDDYTFIFSLSDNKILARFPQISIKIFEKGRKPVFMNGNALFLNFQGNGCRYYDRATGKYTVPISGLYMFTVQKYGLNDHGSFFILVDNEKKIYSKASLYLFVIMQIFEPSSF